MKFLFQEASNPHFNFCPNFYWSYTKVIQKLKIHIQHKWEGKGYHHCEGGNHPAHSPDLASIDFHLFLHLKKHLDGQKFHEDKEVKTKYVVARVCGGVLWHCNKKICTQAKQMPWRKWHLCWKIVQGILLISI